MERKRREKEAKDKTETHAESRTSNLRVQSISLISHVSDAECARKPCVTEDLRLRCFATLAHRATVSLGEEAKCTAEGTHHAPCQQNSGPLRYLWFCP